MNKFLNYILLLLLFAGCSEDNLTDYRKEPALPAVSIESASLEGYKVRVTGAVNISDGSRLLEYGIAFNESQFGTPAHDNDTTALSFIKPLSEDIQMALVDIEVELLPEKEYYVCVYAVNSAGVVYSENKTVTTGKKDILMMLPGTYIAKTHQSYFYPSAYADYEVTVTKEEDGYYLTGLGSSPFDVEAEYIRLRMELQVVDEDGDSWCKLTIPQQLTRLSTEMNDKKYPLYFLSSAWLFYADDLDVTGKITVTDKVTISLETGYAFVMCDPITHEPKVGSGYAPVDVIYGLTTFPGYGDSELNDLYPRLACELIKK